MSILATPRARFAAFGVAGLVAMSLVAFGVSSIHSGSAAAQVAPSTQPSLVLPSEATSQSESPVAVLAPENSSADAGPHPSSTLATPAPTTQQDGIAGVLSDLPTTRDASQVVVVIGSSVSAHLMLFQQSGGLWSMGLEAWGHVGADGVGTASESSSATPAGVWSLSSAFGTGPDASSGLPYRQIDSSSCWISDSADPEYNTWTERTLCQAPNEHMADYPTQYASGLVIGYNTAPVVPGAGSAFFVHIDNGAPTAGCVSVPAAAVLALMHTVQPGALIAIAASVPALAAL